MKKILEIGAGSQPYFVRYRLAWEPDNYYVALDIDENNLNSSKDSIEKYISEGNEFSIDPVFILSDASNLEFPDGYFDEIVISNTISAPIHHDWDQKGNKVFKNNKNQKIERIIKAEDDPEDPFYLERKKLIEEALRVLKRTGKLSIYTDLIIYGIHSYERILQELKEDASLAHEYDEQESSRIDNLNIQKIKSEENCCCFRAEVLPKSQVYRFVKS